MSLQTFRITAALVASLFGGAQIWSYDGVSSETEVHVTASGELDADDEESWIDISIGETFWAGEEVRDEGTRDIDPGTIGLTPGKNYTVTVTGMDVSGYRAHFKPSEGYTFFINGLERNYFDASTTVLDEISSDEFDVRVEVVPGSVPTPAGQALPLSSGKVVWRVGMGQLRNGKSAGYMSIRKDDLDSTAFQMSSLIYESSSPEIDRVPSVGTIEQVRAPFGLVEVSSITGGYELEFYKSATGPDGNGYYTPSGSPYVTYEITSQASGSKLQVDRFRGSQQSRSVLEKLSSGSEWHMMDWEQIEPVGLDPVRWDNRLFSPNGLVEETQIKATEGESAGLAATRTQDTYVNKSWGRELVTSKLLSTGALD